MNEIQIETLLIGASKKDQNVTSAFTDNTMKRIQQLSSPMPYKHMLTRPLKQPRFALTMAAIIMLVAMLGFSGYAYAIGSDPFSLIKRIIEGNMVKVEYQGRQFEHGVAQTYNDAAVTAYAELNTVQGLAFAAANASAIPTNGVEYLSTPFGYNVPYVYPTLGTVTEVTDQTISIQQEYLLGDKTNPSHAMAQPITISRSAELQFFKDAKYADITHGDIGRLVQLRQSQAIKHRINISEEPTTVTQYFVFALQHSLADFKAADKATINPENTKQPSTSGLVEKNFGKLDNRCLNNGADFCDPAILSNQGQSLYGKGLENSNRHVIPFGEGVGPGKVQPHLLLRNVYGTLKEITPKTITIQGSSGSTWSLAFTADQQEHFKSVWGSKIKVGDTIGGSVLQSVSELDSRTIANDHIYNLLRVNIH